MQSGTARVGVGVVLIAAAVILFVALKGGDGSGDSATGPTATGTTATGNQAGSTANNAARPATPTIVVKNGGPAGGVRELDYTQGEEIRFKVDSDVSDEVHVHGYDVMKDVEAGGSVSFGFPADIEGIFEVELEGRTQQIAEIRVNP